jgi:hypothetical protein
MVLAGWLQMNSYLDLHGYCEEGVFVLFPVLLLLPSGLLVFLLTWLRRWAHCLSFFLSSSSLLLTALGSDSIVVCQEKEGVKEDEEKKKES